MVLSYEHNRAIHQRDEAKQKIGMEFTLKYDVERFGKYTIPKGTKVKVIDYFWMYGYTIRDNKGRVGKVWEVG